MSCCKWHKLTERSGLKARSGLPRTFHALSDLDSCDFMMRMNELDEDEIDDDELDDGELDDEQKSLLKNLLR